jgi:alkylated DNA nucleotide flippase Atl1
MAIRRKTWREKLADDRGLPRIVTMRGRLARRWGPGTCVIPRPREVNAIIRRVPAGRLITINKIRAKLARKHGATISCPICTGIFASIAARAAAEEAAAGRGRTTPYWRTLKEGGVANEKYPGGSQKRLLEKEGHRVVRKGKRWVVRDFERALVRT